MRIVVARRMGRRGEGLGNEIISWSKGYLAAAALGAHLVGPGWGLNRRRYYRNFRTPRWDVLTEDFLARLPHRTFTEDDYQASGVVHFDDAIRVWADRHELARKSYIVTVGGMYGGYASIEHAKPFLWNKLLGSRDAQSHIYDLLRLQDGSKLQVAVHMRFGGDFTTSQSGEVVRSKFNFRVPSAWYRNVCESLRHQFGDRVQFYFYTDRGGPEYEDIVRRFNPGQKRQEGLTECSDLVMMAMADVRVCSVSSYSLVASFLGCGSYLWYEPQLHLEEGYYSLWGHEPAQRRPESPTKRAIAQFNLNPPGSIPIEGVAGWPVGGDGEIPAGCFELLLRRLNGKDAAGDLLRYGALPRELITAAQSRAKQE